MRDQPGRRIAPSPDEVDGVREVVRAAAAHPEHVDLLEGQVADPDRRVARSRGRRRRRGRPAPRARSPSARGRDAGRLEHDLRPVRARPLACGGDGVAARVYVQEVGAARALRAPAGSRACRRAARTRRGRSPPARGPDRSGRRRGRRRARRRRHVRGPRCAWRSRPARRARPAPGSWSPTGKTCAAGRTSRSCSAPSRWMPVRLMLDAGVATPDAARVAVTAGGDRPDRDAHPGREVRRGIRAESTIVAAASCPWILGYRTKGRRSCRCRRGSSGSRSRTAPPPPGRREPRPGRAFPASGRRRPPSPSGSCDRCSHAASSGIESRSRWRRNGTGT